MDGGEAHLSLRGILEYLISYPDHVIITPLKLREKYNHTAYKVLDSDQRHVAILMLGSLSGTDSEFQLVQGTKVLADKPNEKVRKPNFLLVSNVYFYEEKANIVSTLLFGCLLSDADDKH